MKALSSYTSCVGILTLFTMFFPSLLTGSFGQLLGLGAAVFGVLSIAEGQYHGRSVLASVALLVIVTATVWVLMGMIATMQIGLLG
jgi:hypothetical protein